MTASLVLCLTLLGADPVSGSPDYIPSVGDDAVVHRYDPEADESALQIEAWTDPTALAGFSRAFHAPALLRERNRVLGDRKKFLPVLDRQRAELLEPARERGVLVRLPDMTPVRVLALGSFTPPSGTLLAGLGAVRADHLLVEVVDGPQKGRTVWTSVRDVRVPGAKKPSAIDFEGGFPGAGSGDGGGEDVGDPDGSKKSAGPAQILVLDANRHTIGVHLVKTDVRVRNVSGRRLHSVSVTIEFLDSSDRLVTTGIAMVGTLDPGETRVCTTQDSFDSPVDRWTYSFDERKSGNERGVLEHAVAKAPGYQRPALKRKR